MVYVACRYMRAVEFPGKVTLTAPYLDHGGAGYIVTISHTIYEGKSVLLTVTSLYRHFQWIFFECLIH